MRKPLFALFGWAVRSGIRLGYNLMEEPRTKALYDYTYDRLRPRGVTQMALRGRPFWVDADARGLAPKLLLLGSYEPHLTTLIESKLRPGMTVLDIGANIGYFTAIAAERVGASGHVVAFEPDPQNFEVLGRNAGTMHEAQLDLCGIALSDHAGCSTLFRDYRSSSRSTLIGAAVRKPGSEIEVSLTTLDAYLGCGGERIDFIKMDAEGSEGAIILGGRRTIERWKPAIMMEFWPFAMAENGTEPLTVLDLLSDLGYAFYLIGQDAQLEPVRPHSLVERATAKLPSGRGHLDLYLESREL